MSLLSLIGIGTAYAATAAEAAKHQSAAAGFISILPMMILLIAVFYFLLVRPQSKRAKEQRQMLEKLSIGDEVVTAGGMVGRLSKLRDNFVILAISKDIEIMMQKSSIASVLPKGTMDSVK